MMCSDGASCTGRHRDQQCGGVVRNRDDQRAGAFERGMAEDLGVRGVAIQHRDVELMQPFEEARVGFHDEPRDLRLPQHVGNVPSHAAAADDHDVIRSASRRV